MKKPFRYYGGKANLMPELLKLMPKHTTYVEVFGGSGALLFAKKKEVSELEVYNDLDHDLVNFFRVLKDKSKLEELMWKIECTPYSREEYDYCLETLDSLPPDSVERAYRWYVLASMCISGIVKSGWSHNVTPLGAYCKVWATIPESLQEFHERIMDVEIENKDFRELIKTYDRDYAFFYADPPYVSETRITEKVYEHEMTLADHQDLVNLMLESKGKFLLSGYKHPVYNLLTKSGWNMKEVEVPCGISVAGERTMRTEVLWFNYKQGGIFNY
jgi:DNA adenine methylase